MRSTYLAESTTERGFCAFEGRNNHGGVLQAGATKESLSVLLMVSHFRDLVFAVWFVGESFSFIPLETFS